MCSIGIVVIGGIGSMVTTVFGIVGMIGNIVICSIRIIDIIVIGIFKYCYWYC